MSGPAQVRSSDAIEALSAALARFEQRVRAALDTLDGEIRRASDWVEHNRPSHWRRQTREAEKWLNEAKVELQRCLMFTLEGERPACHEQKAAVHAAKARLAYCQEKSEIVKKWQGNLRHESLEFHGRVGQLRRAIEQDVPVARQTLVKILRRLEEYNLERPPEAFDAGTTPQAASMEATTRVAASTPMPPPTPAKPLEPS